MSAQYATAAQMTQEAAQVSRQLAERLSHLFAPLLTALDRQGDVRLVRTFLATIAAILQFRNRAQGLLLSELGALLTSPEHAPAGTKRLSNLLRSPKWTSALIERYLWQQANEHLEHWEQEGSLALCIWDGSVLEKAESDHLEGLCAVRSSKAKRLRKLKPGVFNHLGGPPIVVRGMEWTAVLLASLKDVPTVIVMRWWSRKGAPATTQREVEARVLEQVAGAWGERVLHVFDRGYASRAWLGLLQEAEIRFVIRWQKGHVVLDVLGQERKVWQLIQGKRPQERRMVFDVRSRQLHLTGINVVPFRHPGYAGPLWLVVARPGKGREPWYLVTNRAIPSLEQGWQLIFAYARRWQIELTFRFTKSELGMESPRLWKWEHRLKLLLIVTLAYLFLLSLVHPLHLTLRTWLLRHFCHRTGKRCREVTAPLYRLRWALSRLWQAYDPRPFLCLPQTSG